MKEAVHSHYVLSFIGVQRNADAGTAADHGAGQACCQIAASVANAYHAFTCRSIYPSRAYISLLLSCSVSSLLSLSLSLFSPHIHSHDCSFCADIHPFLLSGLQSPAPELQEEVLSHLQCDIMRSLTALRDNTI